VNSKRLADLDPLDLEIVEKALDGAWTTVKDAWTSVKEKTVLAELDSDEELEAFLRRELMEIACFHGVSDPETLRDILLSELPRRRTHRLE